MKKQNNQDTPPPLKQVDHFIPYKTLFYDGNCTFCNKWARWVMRKDQSKSIYLAAADSRSELLLQWGIDASVTTRSVLYYKNGRFYSESDAVIELAADLGPGYAWARFLRFVPKWIRDNVYRMIAANRYRLSKPLKHCPMLPPEEHWRVLW